MKLSEKILKEAVVDSTTDLKSLVKSYLSKENILDLASVRSIPNGGVKFEINSRFNPKALKVLKQNKAKSSEVYDYKYYDKTIKNFFKDYHINGSFYNYGFTVIIFPEDPMPKNIVRLQIGSKVREEYGNEYSAKELISKLSKISAENIAWCSQNLGIKWLNGIIYKVDRGESFGTGFALLGKDKRGSEIMFDRRETANAGAGQTIVHSVKNSMSFNDIKMYLNNGKPVSIVDGRLVVTKS